MIPRPLAFLACSFLLAPLALGQTDQPKDPRIDAATGRSKSVWPRSPRFDFVHMRLELDIEDISKATLAGRQVLTVSPLGVDRPELLLDCKGPVVTAAAVDGVPAAFEQSPGGLRVRPAGGFPVGREYQVEVRYDLEYGGNKGEGLTYSPAEPDAKSETRKFPQIHSQGEPEVNSRWFPCHDFPNERLTTELLVTVEDGYEVVSNGRLLDASKGADGRVTWHWLQDKPHTTYLVALAIAKFGVIDLGGPESGRPGLSIPVYTPLGTEKNVRESFANTPTMIALFERLFDEPYPWDKYAQVIVRDFAAGGMENTSATFLMPGVAGAADRGDHDDLISHELGHQWFGDLVTCHGWAHLWLNEGWASYCEALWAEHYNREGEPRKPDAGRDAYFRQILQSIRGQRGRNRGTAPTQPAMVSNRYSDPDAVFSKADDPYGKGCVVLHMLRERVGDEAFFKATAACLDRFKFGYAETDDFRRVFEEVSGQSLRRFFDQWCYRPGMARLAVDLEWNDATRALGVTIEQTQRIDRLNPAYVFSLPIYLRYEDGTDEWIDLAVESGTTTGSFSLKAKPSAVTVDPNITVFAATQTRKPLSMWIDDALHGPTLPARLAAISALRASEDPEASRVLGTLEADGRTAGLVREATDLTSAMIRN
ncbi:MAG: M1 family peptidase [Leptolyngbya sp. PLA1]|nr:M1 family peptidase [Leptolyngbya sp. PLA1]